MDEVTIQLCSEHLMFEMTRIAVPLTYGDRAMRYQEKSHPGGLRGLYISEAGADQLLGYLSVGMETPGDGRARRTQ